LGAFLALINPIASILDRIIPDKSQAAAAKAALLQSEVQGEFSNALAQIQTDQAEATNTSIFVAGWRPFVGWVCGAAFAYAFIVQPLLKFVLSAFHVQVETPVIDFSAMSPVLLGMLGLGAMRSYDKAQGTDNGH
jgi:hypothetical protein